jgi:hypothetical protein
MVKEKQISTKYIRDNITTIDGSQERGRHPLALETRYGFSRLLQVPDPMPYANSK